MNVYGIIKGKNTYKNKCKNSVNVIKNQSMFVPYKVCNEELENHFDLLFIDDGNSNKHYCYIKDFSRLVRNQVTNIRQKWLFVKDV